MNDQHDIFICYNSEDELCVINIAENLVVRGLKPWLDVWELKKRNKAIDQTLENISDNIKTIAIFVGERGVGPWENPGIDSLIRHYYEKKLTIITVFLPISPTNIDLPVNLTSNFVDFRTGTFEKNFDIFLSLIKSRTITTDNTPPILNEVFSNAGFPDFTYIKPSIYYDVENDILQPGKHVLLIGSSGSGKTCIFTRIMRSLNYREETKKIFDI